MRIVKNAVIVLMLATAAAVLALGPRADRGVPAHRVVVDYWEKWTGQEGAQMARVVADYNRTRGADRGIYVRFVSTSNVDRKTLVAIAAGVPPDIAGMWDAQLTQFAALDALTPLDDLAAARGITPATYKRVYWDACHYGGHLYCLVSTPWTTALIYNKRLWREAGLDPDRPPRTLNELDQYAARLDRKDAGGRIVQAGLLPAASWYTQQMPYWFGGHLWDPARHRFTLTDPAVVAGFAWIQSYSLRMGAVATNDFKSGLGNFDSPQNPFLDGLEAMDLQGPWMANYILNNKPSMFGPGTTAANYDVARPAAQRRAACEWAAAPFPSAVPGLDGVTYAGFDCLTIPRGTKHPAEAFDFLAWLTTQPVMEHLCNLHSKNSPLAAVSDDFLQHHKNPYIQTWDALAASPNARGLPQVPIWPEVSDELTDVVARLVLLQGEPKALLAGAQVRLQEKYDAFAAQQRARRGEASG